MFITEGRLTWVARVVCRRRGWLVLASPRPEVAALLESAGTRAVVPVYDTVRQAVGGSRALAPAYARQHLGREELEGPF
jgi:hypothetical protein